MILLSTMLIKFLINVTYNIYTIWNCTFNSHNFYRTLEQASKLKRLIVSYLYIDNALEEQSNLKHFSGIEFKNLKEICFKLSLDEITMSCYLSRILLVLSKNESLRSNLESFKFVDWIFHSDQHIYDLLKAKSFGYIKCKVYEHNACGEYIELYEPKITK